MSTLTPEQTNAMIAESLGWTHNEYDSDMWYHQDAPQCQDGKYCTVDDLPNFHGSLDACAQFEATLDDKTGGHYWQQMDTICGYPSDLYKLVCATPAQRCLAYLKTKGLLP